MNDYGPCPVCGATSDQFLVPVWDDPSAYDDEPPDYLGCTECNTMTEVDR